jgi:hypothetical protein
MERMPFSPPLIEWGMNTILPYPKLSKIERRINLIAYTDINLQN